MLCLTLRLLATACILYQIHGFPHFRDHIPNGRNVKNPCDSKEDWLGVGHEAIGGGRKPNPFGLDFKNQGYTWTKDLCNMDSDGDGVSNGAELGDPDCAWIQNAIPQRSSNISHPGICEPIGSQKCQNSFLKSCSDLKFKCDGIDNDDDVFPVDLRLTEYNVPAEETTYMCQAFDLEKREGVNMDIDYHLVATKGYIDTVEVMHHVVVYGCENSANIPEDLWSPNVCFMSRVENCSHVIGIWAVGSKGICFHRDAGIRIGKSGFTKFILELHWNNEEKRNDFTDSSGLTFFLTPNLRPHDAGMFTIGQMELNIPPKTPRYSVEGTCTSECTDRVMTDNINIVGAMNHMHGLGSAVTSSMVSDSGKETIISHEESYDYNSPKFVVFDDPLVFEKGHSLEIKCHFNSTTRNEVTRYGEATSDEMCFAFIMYYPMENWQSGVDCIADGDITYCGDNAIGGNCDFEALGNPLHPDTQRRNELLYQFCEPGICKTGCIDVVREIFKEPCFQEDNFNLIKSAMNTNNTGIRFGIMDFVYRIDSCNTELAREECRNEWTTPPVGRATSSKMASSIFICIFTILSFVM